MQARIFSLSTTITLSLLVSLSAWGQGLTSSTKITLLNANHNRLELHAPASVFTNYTLTFPAGSPVTGGLGYFSNSSGQLAWLAPGSDGQILTLASGIPIWSTPSSFAGWLTTGNPTLSAYNGISGSFIGTTTTQPFVLATTNTGTAQPIEFFTNNAERARIASTGELLVGTSTPQGTLTVNGETYTKTTQYSTQIPDPTAVEGRVFYDSAEHALTYFNDDLTDHVVLGQENIVRVRNMTGSTILAGSAVYINGNDPVSGLPTVALAKADQLATSNAIGITHKAIANNASGYVQHFGVIDNVNTLGYPAGAELYLSATTAGALTTTRPSQPNLSNPLANVENSAASGTILVKGGNLRQGAMSTGAIAFGGADGFLRESPNKLFFDSSNGRVGIGTNSPNCLLDIDGDYATRIYNLTLSNGQNNNISPGAHTCVQITGPTAAYSITGIAGGTNGKQLHLTNMTSRAMTLSHQNTNSTSANRIYNPSGQDIMIADSGTISLVYNTTLNAWLVRNAGGAISGANGFIFIRKKSDQSVTNSTTLQADSDLWFIAAPNSVYQITTSVMDSGVGGVVATFAATVPSGAEVSAVVITGISGNAGANANMDIDIIRMGVLTTGSGAITLSGKAGFSSAQILIRTGSTGGKCQIYWGMTSAGTGKTLWIFKDSYAQVRLVEQY